MAKEIPDLATADADVPRRYIGVGTDVPKQFCHERLAKSHDFPVGFAFWIEVRAALAAPHWQTCKRILKHLFERQKLDDARIDGRMKTQPAFVRTQCAIHLHAKPAVDLDPSFVVDPRNTKLNHSLWFHEALQNSGVSDLLVAVDDRAYRLQHLRDRLKKLRLVRVTFSYDFENFLNQSHGICDYLLLRRVWQTTCAMQGSNLRLLACEASALPLS